MPSSGNMAKIMASELYAQGRGCLLLMLFYSVIILPSCLLNICFLLFVLLSTLVNEASYCCGEWVMQRLLIVQSAENM